MARSKVAILRTSPATVLRDHHALMNLAGCQDVLAKGADTARQLDGVTRTLPADGHQRDLVHTCHNRTVAIYRGPLRKPIEWSLGIPGMCVTQAPEFASRRRHQTPHSAA